MSKLRAFAISLPHQRARRDTFLSWWHGRGYEQQFSLEFLPAVSISPSLTGQQRVSAADSACAASHRAAVATALAEDLEGCIVFEDDAEAEVDGSELFEFITGALAQVRSAWHTVNLGGCMAQWRPATPRLRATLVAPGVAAVRGMVSTHAILYHRRVFEDVLAAVPSAAEITTRGGCFITGRPYDQWLAGHGTMLTGMKPFITQSGATSDILGMPHHVKVRDLIEQTYERIRHACAGNSVDKHNA